MNYKKDKQLNVIILPGIVLPEFFRILFVLKTKRGNFGLKLPLSSICFQNINKDAIPARFVISKPR